MTTTALVQEKTSMSTEAISNCVATIPDADDDSAAVDVTAITRLKHADLWQACKGFAHGRYGGQSGLARHLGVSASELGTWLNLKACPPRSPTRGWPEDRLSRLESQLIELTGKTLEQLFPDDLRSSVMFLQSPKVYEQTATLRADAMERYAIATAERLRLAAQPVLPAEHEELTNDIRSALQVLTHREREVVLMRYGLEGCRQHTLEEAAEVFGVSRERVRQIEAKAIRKLQRSRSHVQQLLEHRWS